MTEPVVISSESMNDSKPVNLLDQKRRNTSQRMGSYETEAERHRLRDLHCRHAPCGIPLWTEYRCERAQPEQTGGSAMGLTEPGWKSDIEKQIFLSGWKRPEGVNI